MIYGIGIDIVSIARLEALQGQYNDPFFKKTYTEAEHTAGMGRPNPIIYFSERFAVKEAVFKALHISSVTFRFNEIETLNDGFGQPYVILYGGAKKALVEAGVKRIHVSLSNDSGFVIAYVICET